jgi:hypothetical protein
LLLIFFVLFRYTFYVGPGNNGELVKRTIGRRPWWKECTNRESLDWNLFWVQVRDKKAAEEAKRRNKGNQFLNHLEGLTDMCDKSKLFQNLKSYCHRMKRNLFDIVPNTYIITHGQNNSDYMEFCNHIKSIGDKSKGPAASSATVVPAPRSRSSENIRPEPEPALAASVLSATATKGRAPPRAGSIAPSRPRPFLAVLETSAKVAPTSATPVKQCPKGRSQSAVVGSVSNHPMGIANFAATGQSMAIAQKDTPTKENVPPAPNAAAAAGALATVAKSSQSSSLDAGKNLWIVKPTHANRGTGIRMFRSLGAIQAHLAEKGGTMVVQKYVECPLLLMNRKFDIRCLVFVDVQMNVYMYQDSYVRMSSYTYDTENLEDRSIHLTNYAVQKKTEAASQFEEGNNLTLDDFQRIVREEHPDKPEFDVQRDIVEQYKKLIVETFNACKDKLNPFREKHTFEVYGFDFLVDANFKVWLLEVNTNPYIGCSSAIITRIFTGMLEGVVRLTIDPYFPGPANAPPIEDVEGADRWLKASLVCCLVDCANCRR